MSEALISSEIAEPYAQALMSVAQQHNLTEEFGESFRQLLSLMEESDEFSAFVANPIIKAEDKKNVLRRVLGDSANPYLINFLMLLIDKRRIIFLKQVAEQYLNLLRKLNQTVLAEVIAAKELTDSQQQAVIDRVKAISQAQNVELKTSVDPSLIGGVVIKIGSQVIDASLRGQLRRISMSLNT
ncbi:ATP synthase subunit delta [Stanieria cyanosphaera PCC 7437]|uniref:ATP synthase subunit delta n=1 Tax=Stanieria cyanosphaera (strain ATCC 29371 / PCC 7437) TaxID=111780 RepID=K9XYH9_STAC7|nr:ATP synthase F1 subunit delta [Stanieria cyanosphaera]AFZ36737.1 ATP synthase subunit delta [Stanieria cyanosphaera PCC 7437]